MRRLGHEECVDGLALEVGRFAALLDGADPGVGPRHHVHFWSRRQLHETTMHRIDDAQILDLLLLCGWYHAISFGANGARVALEDGAPRFADLI